MNSVKGILPVIDRGLKVIDVGGVFELDANRIPILRSGTSTDLNGEDRRVIGKTREVEVVFRDLGHVEERDGEGIGGLNQQDPEGGPSKEHTPKR